MDLNPVWVCVVADEANVRAKLEHLLMCCDEFRCLDSFAKANETLTDMTITNRQIVLLNVGPLGLY